MAWVEGQTWEMEQGRDATLEFHLEDGLGNAWPFIGWDINATLSDDKASAIWPVSVSTMPVEGIVKLIFPEDMVNSLRVGKPYRYDCLMTAPGTSVGDDHYLAAGLVMVALRTTRRDP